MGLFFQSNTWRAPLQLIDCWLPSPETNRRERAPAQRAVDASPTLVRFARAGWLGREPSPAANQTIAVPAQRMIRGHGRVVRGDARVVLSGRVDEVCEALDRLAARDEADQQRRAA